MNSFSGREAMETVADLLRDVHCKGVRLWSDNGQLHYRAPKDVLTKEQIQRLQESRSQIVAVLERATRAQSVAPSVVPRARRDRAPLTFSQLAHWQSHQLRQRRTARSVASATRLRGQLDSEALRASVAEISRRHDALRTRIAVYNGIPCQEIDEPGNFDLKVDDLTTVSESQRETLVKLLIEQFLAEPIDVTVDPLFGARLFRLQEDEHVLVVAMEHIISDGTSLTILLRELLAAYVQASKGFPFSLPAVPIQFPDYALWQRNTEKSLVEAHSAYWTDQLTGCRRLKFPDSKHLPTTIGSGWEMTTLQIRRDLTAQLREWCRVRQTTLVMSVFTAYVGLVLRWCNASEVVIQYQSDSRTSPKIENTIGYFSSQLYLRIGIQESDRFVDLLNHVTAQYCKAYEHADFSYLAAQVPRLEFTQNSFFNWLPQSSNIDILGARDAITCSQFPIDNRWRTTLELDNEPGVLLTESDDNICVAVYFPVKRFSVESMERLGRNFLVFVTTLLSQPERRVKDIWLCD